MNNAEWLLKQGIKFSDLTFYANTTWSYIVKDSRTGAKVGTIHTNTEFNSATRKLAEWLDEKHVEKPLTAKENAYLSTIIKPFRNRILSIEKGLGNGDDAERLHFSFNDDSKDEFCLPPFKAGTAYKGMLLYHHYTLEDLGL